MKQKQFRIKGKQRDEEENEQIEENVLKKKDPCYNRRKTVGKLSRYLLLNNSNL